MGIWQRSPSPELAVAQSSAPAGSAMPSGTALAVTWANLVSVFIFIPMWKAVSSKYFQQHKNTTYNMASLTIWKIEKSSSLKALMLNVERKSSATLKVHLHEIFFYLQSFI
jgi:hypothetical protein